MTENDLIPRAQERTSIIEQRFERMTLAMRGMADMLRAMNESMAELTKQVRLLTKVTPMQARELNAAITARAKAICQMYRAPGCEKRVAAAIRRDIRLMQGVRSVRDLPMCEYAVTVSQIGMWDDYKAIKAIKERAEKAGDNK